MARQTEHSTRLTVRDPGELLAVVPHLLGFHPQDSVVAVCVHGRSRARLGCTARGDLPPPELVEQVAWSLGRAVAAQHPTEVSLFVVGGSGDPTADPSGPLRRDVVEALDGVCTALRLPVRERVWAPAVRSGARWCCYDTCGCSGRLPDPAASAVAAASVLDGQVTFASRAELERLVAPDDGAALVRRSALVERALDAALLDREMTGPGAAGRDLVAVTDALWEVAAGRGVFGDAELAQLAVALSDPLVRDACFTFAEGEHAAAAERLWITLTRSSPSPEVAEPAVLLAFSALQRGNGALAQAALQRARMAWPGHRLTAIFDAALGGCVGPGRLRTWVLAAAVAARRRLEGASC